MWYDPDPQAHDQRSWPRILAALGPGSLLLYDLGYANFARVVELTVAQLAWLTRAKHNLARTVLRKLVETPAVRDRLVWVGSGAECQQFRLLEVLTGTTWRRFLTNELDPQRLPAVKAAALCGQRGRIEAAYLHYKRLLGSAYFWTGSHNGVELELWDALLLCAVLIDLTDVVAERVKQPFGAISVEMVYRGLYHFSQTFHRAASQDPVEYLAEHAGLLGIPKRPKTRMRLTNTLRSPHFGDAWSRRLGGMRSHRQNGFSLRVRVTVNTTRRRRSRFVSSSYRVPALH